MHFFCDLTNIGTESESFGPILHDNLTDPPSPEKTFNVGSKFTISTITKAFACESGMMIVHQSTDSNLVNVLIKPTATSKSSLQYGLVKYYLYRGLRKSDFISGTDVLPNNPSANSEFINRFWVNRSNMDPVPTAPPTSQVLGYDIALSGSLNVESIFNNQQADVRAIYVKEGEWIGNFAVTTGDKRAVLEIITDTSNFNNSYSSGTGELTYKGLDLDYLASENYYIDLNGIPDVSDADKFKLRIRKEEITSYIDPAAFFGMHNSIGMDTSTYSGSTKTTLEKKEPNLYTDVLVKFINKNRVYFDIRSENGYSYDFYQNYDTANNGKILQVGLDGATVVSVNYFKENWPLYYYDTTAVGNTFFSKIALQLKIEDNEDPILFISDSNVRVKRKDDLKYEDDLIPDPAGPFTKSVEFKLPIHSTGSNENIAYTVKMQYLRMKTTGLPVTVPKQDHFLDSVFADIDLAYRDGSISVFQENSSAKLNPVIAPEFKMLNSSKVYETGTLISFLSQRKYTYTESEEEYSKLGGDFVANVKDVNTAQTFPQNMVFTKFDLIEGVNAIPTIDVPLLSLEGTTTKKEALFILFLTKLELDQLRLLADTVGLSDKHKRTIVFSGRSQENDDNSFPYIKYELKVQGLLESDASALTSSGSGIFVYTFGDRIFNSKDAGALINAPYEIPDAGTLTTYPHYGLFKYDDSNNGSYHSSGFARITYDDHESTKKTAVLRGSCYYPSMTENGPIVPLESFPLIIIAHGNGQYYRQYETLCKHLAKNGFVASTISCLVQMDKRVYNLSAVSSLPAIAQTAINSINAMYSNVAIDYAFTTGDFQNVLYDTTYDSWYKLKYFPATVGSPASYEVEGYPVPESTYTFIPGSPSKMKFALQSSLHDVHALGRAQLIPEHIKLLKNKFSASLENKVGIMGHSRGGEGVVYGANTMLDPGSTTNSELAAINMDNLLAVLSLAPSHQFHQWIGSNEFNPASLTRKFLNRDVHFLGLYGSRDYDVRGYTYTDDTLTAFNTNKYVDDSIFMGTAFSLYDTAVGTSKSKSMIFIKAATHNGFITSNSPDINASKSYSSTIHANATSGKMLPTAQQKKACFAYTNAFFRMHLLDESFWLPYFTGHAIPKSAGTKNIYSQYERYNQKYVVDDMENGGAWSTSSSGNDVKLNGSASAGVGKITKNSLRRSDSNLHAAIKESFSPHTTSGIRIYWKGTDKDILTFEIGVTDITPYSHLSFRIGSSSRNKNLEGMKIGLNDNVNPPYFHDLKTIDSPDVRTDFLYGNTDVDATMTPMQTIRIPLSEFQTGGINLSDTKEIIFKFPETGAGKVHLDNVMLTN